MCCIIARYGIFRSVEKEMITGVIKQNYDNPKTHSVYYRARPLLKKHKCTACSVYNSTCDYTMSCLVSVCFVLRRYCVTGTRMRCSLEVCRGSSQHRAGEGIGVAQHVSMNDECGITPLD